MHAWEKEPLLPLVPPESSRSSKRQASHFAGGGLAPARSAPAAAAAIDWPWLRSFVAVMDCGNLTAAARSLGTTQPTVGRHIRLLEQRIGETLFDRRPSGLVPTARATDLYERSAAVEQAVTGLSTSLGSASPLLAGSVRITTSMIFAVELLPQLLAPLLALHERLQVELMAGDDLRNLIRREADVAVRFVRPDQPEVVASKVGEVAVGLYAHRDYLRRAGTPRRKPQLKGHALVGFESAGAIVREAARLGVALDPRDVRLHSDNFLVQLAAVRSGTGIGAVHTWLAAKHPELVRVLPGLDVSRLPVWVATHDDFHRSRRMRAVFEHLASELGQRFRAS